jgi:hypothetical protein
MPGTHFRGWKQIDNGRADATGIKEHLLSAVFDISTEQRLPVSAVISAFRVGNKI